MEFGLIKSKLTTEYSFNGEAAHLPEVVVEKCHFGAMTSDMVRQLSVVQITQTQTFDRTSLEPMDNGVYDRRMGTLEESSECQTCYENSLHCLGHYGHIDLAPIFVYNPLFYPDLLKLLRGICLNCFQLHCSEQKMNVFSIQMNLLHLGNLELFDDFTANTNYLLSEPEQLDILCKTTSGRIDQSQLWNHSPCMNRAVVHARFNIVKNFTNECFATKSKNCPHCFYPQLIFKNDKSIRIISTKRKSISARMMQKEVERKKEKNSNDSEISPESAINPNSARDIVRAAWKLNPLVLQFVFGDPYSRHPPSPEMFFMSAIPVIPPRFRPYAVIDSRKSEHAQTAVYTNILRCFQPIQLLGKFATGEYDENTTLTASEEEMLAKCKGNDIEEKYWWTLSEVLQRAVNCLFDSSKVNQEGLKGIKQIIEKKQGIIRTNLMGKRVNYGARSVITPDPMIATNEVGIPFEIACKLTFPEAITSINSNRAMKLISNGPNVYPGAKYIVQKDGSTVHLGFRDHRQQRRLLQDVFKWNRETPRVIMRHVQDGDIVILNRQPTLHKPSMQAHFVRVLRGEKTIRLHYSACKAYNADFDGDEMNIHFPQGLVARSEAYHLMNSANFYLSPKDGAPLGGLIQDHIVAAVHLSMRGTFFTKAQFQQLIMSAFPQYSGTIKLMRPTIIKPKQLWTGKQVFSALIKHTIPKGKALPNLEGKSKVGLKLWLKDKGVDGKSIQQCEKLKMDESMIRISKGELLQGVFDKSSIGSASYSFTHCIYELYGPEACSKFLSACSKLLTSYLQNFRGFTVGVKDVMCTKEAERFRRKINRTIEKVGVKASAAALLEVDDNGDESSADQLDVSEVRKELESVHRKRDMFKLTFWENKMTGELGKVNQTLTQACVPYGLKSKFPENNFLMMIESGAKGSGINMAQMAAQNGQIELEGRRIPMQLSGKHLPCFKAYDLNPVAGGYANNRFLTGLGPCQFLFHCMAGREGLVDTVVKTSRSGYLQRCLIKFLEGVKVCYDHTVRDSDSSVVQFLFGEDGLDPIKCSFLGKEATLKTLLNNKEVYKEKAKQYELSTDSERVPAYINERLLLEENSEDEKPQFVGNKVCSKRRKPTSNPLIADISPWNHFGSVSESYEQLKSSLCESDKNSKKASNMLNFKYLQCLMEPGEAIGLITSQSIGEPSTQMTLNTFHFAGRGEVNVTLGIPRLKELLQTSSENIKTPTMTVPIRNIPGAKEAVERLTKQVRKVYLENVLQSINIESSYVKENSGYWKQQYKVKFEFISRKSLRTFTHIKPRHILKFVEQTFLNYVGSKYNKVLRAYQSSVGMFTTSTDETLDEHGNLVKMNRRGTAALGGASGGRGRLLSDADSDAELDSEQAGASADKQRSKIDDEQDYDDDKDTDDEMLQQSDTEMPAEDNPDENPETEIKKEADTTNNNNMDDVVKDNSKTTEIKSVDVTNCVSDESYAKRRKSLLEISDDSLVDYEFDPATEKHCTVTYQFGIYESPLDFPNFIREECSKAVVSAKAKGISRAFISEDNFVTEGVNIDFIGLHSKILDVSKLYTNSVHHLLLHFGVEAAYRGIIKELQNVFGSYGINVDRRHLSLIGDFMTRDGSIKAFDRKQIACNPSHLQRASFESAVKFLKEASLSGYPDDMFSPSSCVAVGKICSLGTGVFDLMEKNTVKVKKFKERNSISTANFSY